MKSTTSYGVCALCGERAAKTKVAAHLKICAPTHDQSRTEPTFQLRVDSGELPIFWIDLEAKALATLADLDRFLRKTWLECCGHMSDFRVGGIAYTAASDGLEPGERSMNITLAEVVERGAKRLAYQYDFGSTTELMLHVVGAREGGFGRKKLRVLARNEPLDWPCAVCGDSAELICAICRDDQAPFETLDVYRGGLPRRALALVLEWAALHRNELRRDWDLARNGRLPEPITPLE